MYNNSNECSDKNRFGSSNNPPDQSSQNASTQEGAAASTSSLAPYAIVPNVRQHEISSANSPNTSDVCNHLQSSEQQSFAGAPNATVINGFSNDTQSNWQHQELQTTSGDTAQQHVDASLQTKLTAANHNNGTQFNNYYSSFTQQHPASTSRNSGRQHIIVPPNNHSPKQVVFSNQQQQQQQQQHGYTNRNGSHEAVNYNGAGPQQIYQFRKASNHDTLGNVTGHQDGVHVQPFFSNGYPAKMSLPSNSNTKNWATHSQQRVNPMRSLMNNETESSYINGSQTTSSLLTQFGSSTSVSAATAVANIASLIQASTSSNLPNDNDIVQSSGVAVAGTQRSSAYSQKGTISNSQLNTGYPECNDQSDKDPLPQEHGIQHSMNARNHQTLMHDRVLHLQRELENERSIRCQLQQRVIDLTQQVHTQNLVENSYEEVVQKYKMVVAQLQRMSLALERYKSMTHQLEQERQVLSAENTTLKAQKSTVVNDKTMKYNMLVERSKKLEEENSGLVLENETYQRQYEKCVDEISKQVVQALLTQKALQEQCMQLQDRLVDLERENCEYYEAAVRQARQASSDSRLGWSYRRARTQAASPSADSVRSMPAQHLYWKQSSISSLEHQQNIEAAADKTVEKGSTSPDMKAATNPPVAHSISIETEFPANNGSPKSTRRNLDRHPSSGSLDSAYHSRGFVKGNGKDVRCQRSVSAEALRDVKVNMRVKADLPKSTTVPAMSAIDPSHIHITHAEVHKDLSPESSLSAADSRLINDPFADDADNILSKHQSLIVGSMEDLFAAVGAGVRNFVIHEEDSGSNSAVSTQERGHIASVPTPPPRPRSRCLSDCSNVNDTNPSPCTQPVFSGRGDTDPPPLPPKQYKGSRRKFKPLPAEPPESQDEEDDSSDKNTDSESIKQELNALTSQIASLTSRSAYHN